ncbi:MAG: ATP phosphoribosyltransferase regulatory subunit [Clostridia bacterium]|nr:ATP phosphoribosyltransferase regulatory subunit [Clostridia bacterium]
MNLTRKQIPVGMQDTLPSECSAKREMESRIRALFSQFGFLEIETPMLEYYEVLDDPVWGFRPEHLWKTFDREGRILALRPDSTVPAARMAGSALKEETLPLRLCYLQNACKMEQDTLSMLSEQPQAGVEIMGLSSPEADAEVIALSARTMQAAGIGDFQLELGHAGFFQAVLEEAGVSKEDAVGIRELTEQKNALALEWHLKSLGLPEAVAEKLKRLPLLFGERDILEEAEAMAEGEKSRAALHNLREIVDLLDMWGCAWHVTLDLGMTQEAGYYSGVIFRGQVAGVGQPILSGGRYDGLPGLYGRSMPAVGFAASLKTCLIALERQGARFQRPVPDVAIAFEKGCLKQALEAAEKERRAGQRTCMVYEGGLEGLMRTPAMRHLYIREHLAEEIGGNQHGE